jgi:hypothetical protein
MSASRIARAVINDSEEKKQRLTPKGALRRNDEN